MNKRLLLVGGALLVAIAATVYFVRRESTVLPPATQTTSPTANTSTPTTVAPSQRPSPSTDSTTPTTALTETFQVDGEGQLVLSTDTRRRIESLLQRSGAEHLPGVKGALTQSLPKDAAEEVAELLDRYQEYQTAARELYSPRSTAATEEEQLEMLENLHALRVEHLGIDAAEGFFAADEADARARLARHESVPELMAPEEAPADPAIEPTNPDVVIPSQ